jgi:hypothetical protein
MNDEKLTYLIDFIVAITISGCIGSLLRIMLGIG